MPFLRKVLNICVRSLGTSWCTSKYTACEVKIPCVDELGVQLNNGNPSMKVVMSDLGLLEAVWIVSINNNFNSLQISCSIYCASG